MSMRPPRPGGWVQNLLKYAMGLDPMDPLDTHQFETLFDGEYLYVVFSHPDELLDIVYDVQVSEDLVDWLTGIGHAEIVQETVVGDTRHVTVRITSPPSEWERVFTRLRMTLKE